MTKPAVGPRDRRHGDVMELLARARPARLDPGQAGLQPAEAAALLAAADRAAADYAAADYAAANREVAGHAGAGPAAARPARRMPRAAVLTGTGLTVAAAAVAVTVLAVSAGGPAMPIVASKGRTHAPVLLTAAMVREVASASRSALALSGRATISYRNSQAGKLQVTGTDRITFSGKNWNDAFSQSFPASDGTPASTQFAINRIVGKQLYLYIAARTRRLQWYHDTNPSGHPSFTIPDPRTVFSMLEPSARFEFLGYQVIDGIRLKHLRATDFSHLRGLSTLPDLPPGAHVTALEVWVDSHNVVHRLSLTAQTITTVYPPGTEYVRHRAHGPLIFIVPNQAMAAQLRARLKKGHGNPPIIIRVHPRPVAPPHHEMQVATVTVTFSGIGQPQRITAPAHAIDQYGRG